MLEQLPDHLLDKLLRTILTGRPSLRTALLSSFGSQIHSSAVRVLFSSLHIADDSHLFDCEESFHKSAITAVIANPSRYAHVVKSLTITNPSLKYTDTQRLEVPRPLGADMISLILQQCCPNLESFCWESSNRPPDGICEQLSLFTTRLQRFRYNPSHPKINSRRKALIKWDAPSLPLLSSLPIATFSLSGLSQSGTRAFIRLLNNLGEDSVLENLNVDLIWFDESLCKAIVEAGGKIRRLCITTNGTKLNDSGLTLIMENLDGLNELILDDVQGRISRSMWTKPTVYPSTLRSLRIYMSEAGPHHSWAADHLDSLHAFPMERLTDICISRRPSLHNDPVDSVVSLKPLPSLISERLRDCKCLANLHCDLWTIPISDLKPILENCLKLETLKICLDDSFSRLLSLTSTFASLSNLRTISVSVDPVHAPGTPPSPILPNVPVFPSSSSEGPVPAGKSKSSQGPDQLQTLEKFSADPSLPLLRDVKRFVRKCPRLQLLEWYGRYGRGSWKVKRPAISSKIGINISVDYSPPIIPSTIWEEILREEDIQTFFNESSSLLEETRPGQLWIGEQADLLTSIAADEDKDAAAEKNIRRGRSRKPGVPSTSTSSSSISDANMPSTPSGMSINSSVEIYSPSASSSASPTEPTFWTQKRDHKRSSEPVLMHQKTKSGRATNDAHVSDTGRGRGRGLRKASVNNEDLGRPSNTKEKTRGSTRGGRGRGRG